MRLIRTGAAALAAALFATTVAAMPCGLPEGVEATPFKPQNQDRREVGKDLDEIRERGWIEFAVYEDFAPWSWMENGRLEGVDVAIGRIIAEELGVEPRFMAVAAGENVDEDLRNWVWRGPVVGGRVANVMLHVPWHVELACRNELVVLTGQYFSDRIGMAWRDDRYPDGPPTPAHFRFETVGVENDSLADFYLSNFMGGALHPNIRRFTTVEDAMAALRAGEVSAVTGALAQLEWGASGEAGLRAEARPMVGLAVGEWTIGAAVRHTFRPLSYAVDDAIMAAVQDGRIPALFEAHGLTWREPAF